MPHEMFIENQTEIHIEQSVPSEIYQESTGPPIIVYSGANTTQWSQISSNVIASNNVSYLVNNTNINPVQIILPINANIGFEFTVLAVEGIFQITQNSSQQIRFGNIFTTSGMAGKIVSSDQGDCIRLVCIQPSVLWVAMLIVGNFNFL